MSAVKWFVREAPPIVSLAPDCRYVEPAPNPQTRELRWEQITPRLQAWLDYLAYHFGPVRIQIEGVLRPVPTPKTEPGWPG